FFTVELLNCCRRFFVSRHFHKRKTFRLSGVTICNHARRFNGSSLGEEVLQILTTGLEREVSHIKFFCHRDPFLGRGRKEAANRIWLRRTVAAKDLVRMLSIKSGFESVKPACSRTIQNVRRPTYVRAHHRRCA